MSLLRILFLIFTIILSFFHWIGIAITGATIGFLSKNYKKALLYSAIFAFLLWISFVLYTAIIGIVEKLMKLPLIYFSLLLTLILSTLSSSVGYFVRNTTQILKHKK